MPKLDDILSVRSNSVMSRNFDSTQTAFASVMNKNPNKGLTMCSHIRGRSIAGLGNNQGSI